jgi:hypothetical protein
MLKYKASLRDMHLQISQLAKLQRACIRAMEHRYELDPLAGASTALANGGFV